MEKKSLYVIVFLLIVVLCLGGYIIYDNLFDNQDNEATNINDNNDDYGLDNQNIFSDYEKELGWIALVSNTDNKIDYDLFSDNYYKQLFAMEKIVNDEGEDDFLKVSPENGPCCEYYYSYKEFSKVYVGVFAEAFDNEVKVIDGNNYAYYDFYRKFGANGWGVDDFNVINLIQKNDVYIASVEIIYNQTTKVNIGVEKVKATIKYIKNDDKIIFKSFIIDEITK